jgi:hypothetical protein
MRAKILGQIREWLEKFGIPWAQYKVKLNEKGDDVWVEMIHKRSGAIIEVNGIIYNDTGEILEFSGPELKVPIER